MLGIAIDAEFLSLAPGTTAQLEQTSPFFNQDDLGGEYSLPLTIDYTPFNARKLQLSNHYYTRRKKVSIAARMYDDNNFAYAGQLVLQNSKLNLNDVGKSKIEANFQTGVSSFFTAVKGKKLKQLQLGGLRTFAWTNNDPYGPYKGFWQHIHDTWTGKYPYAFVPIRNEGWNGTSDDGASGWVCKLDMNNNLDYQNNYNTLVPSISMKYILQQIFTEHGWGFDASDMNDDQWEIIYLPSFYAVTWQKIIQVEEAPYFAYSPLPSVAINLQNHVPPDIDIIGFLLALRNRYNWGFEFDSNKKVCKMFPLKNLANGERKDWTEYVNAALESDYSEDEKIFSFENEIDSADSLASSPDFTKVKKLDPVLKFSEVPAPVEANFNMIIFVGFDNRYYQCTYEENERTYQWTTFADNIYNETPDNANETISTVASTMPVYMTQYRTKDGNEYYGYFPMCNQEGNWEGKTGEFKSWGMRLLFFRGMVREATANGNPGAIKYPYLTSIAFTPTQEEPDLAWSNVYVHRYGTIDFGIINYWWKDTLVYLKNTDITKAVLYLPRQELTNFNWSNQILIRNVKYVMQTIRQDIPYPGRIEADLRRIG